LTLPQKGEHEFDKELSPMLFAEIFSGGAKPSEYNLKSAAMSDQEDRAWISWMR